MCIYIYKYKYLRLKEQLFRIACDPSAPSVGTRGAVACTLLGLVWSSTSATTRAHSPPWHRRRRAKLRRFVKRLRQDLHFPLVSVFVALERLLFSLDITLCLIIHVPPWLVKRSKAYRCHGIKSKLEWNRDDPREATVVKTSPPRRLQSSPSYRHAAVSTSGSSSSSGALPPEVASLLQALASKDQNTASRLDGVLPDPDLRLKPC